MDFKYPVLLRSDNFTPLTRTPWAGRVIAARYKARYAAPNMRIGESWEFSCDPQFPSRIAGTDQILNEAIAANPSAILSASALAQDPQRTVDILVKLLNASDPLSLQLHPADGDLHLKANECGKPESWLVLDAEPGSGIYLGFKQALTLDALRTALESGDAGTKDLLHFVPVRTNDYFEIAPGMPHAVGPGVTLLEPQRVSPNKSGVTYRMWDWGRRYDTQGNVDPNGKPRLLHIDACLDIVDPSVTGPELEARARKTPQHDTPVGGITRLSFSPNAYYGTERLRMVAGCRSKLAIKNGYGVLVLFSGTLQWQGDTGPQTAGAGDTILLPHAAMPVEFQALVACECALIRPSFASPAVWTR